MTQNYLGVVKPEELQALRRAYLGGRSHPLVNLAFSREQASTRQLTAVNTEMAARLVSEKDAARMKALHPRLIATDRLYARCKRTRRNPGLWSAT
jgi:hypothetical protein